MLTCLSGDVYEKSADKNSSRAVLRETAKAYSRMQQAYDKETSSPPKEPTDAASRSSDAVTHDYQPMGETEMKMELLALAGSL